MYYVCDMSWPMSHVLHVTGCSDVRSYRPCLPCAPHSEPQLLTHRGSRTPPCVFPGHLSLSCQGVLRPCRSCPPRFFHLCGPGPGPLGPGPQTPENTSHCVLALHTKEPQNEPCPQNSDPIIKISLSWPIFIRYRVRESGSSSFISTHGNFRPLSLVFCIC